MTTSPLSSELPEPVLEPTAEPRFCEAHPTIAMERWPNARVGNGWFCPECGREARVRADAAAHQRNDAQRLQDAQHLKELELQQAFGRACIPDRYQGYTFATFPAQHERALQHASTLRSYANRFPSMREKGISVLLVGGAGTGKTGLACCVANVVIREHHGTALFTSAYGAVRHMRDTWGRRGRTEREALDQLVMPDLLILDEVGTSVGTDAETAMLFEVFNERYQARRPTIAISNLPLEDFDGAGGKRPGLRTYLGPRIFDRFRDDGSFTLAFDWPSLRGRRE